MGKRGFTLIEVLISIIILAFIGLSSYLAFVTVHRSTEQVTVSTEAISLAQELMEHLRRQAYHNFDQLDNYVLNIDTNFPPPAGFTRAVALDKSSTTSGDIKKIDLSLSWRDQDNKLKTYNYSQIITRPPEPLPGNIAGMIFDASGAPLLSGDVTVRVAEDSNPSNEVSTQSDVSANMIEGHSCNYTFDQNGMQLTSGKWQLTASGRGLSLPAPQTVTVNPSQHTFVDLNLIESKAQLAVSLNNGPSGQEICLYEDGALAENVYNGGVSGPCAKAPCTFDIDIDPALGYRNFTVVTGIAKPGTSSSFPVRNEEDLPWQKGYAAVDGNKCTAPLYDRRGWSSARMYAGGACSNPWEGDESCDLVQVTQGNTTSLVIDMLERKARFQGTVMVEGVPEPGVGMYLLNGWQGYSSWTTKRWLPYPLTYTNGAGRYDFYITAFQEFFPPGAQYTTDLLADKHIGISCCNTPNSLEVGVHAYFTNVKHNSLIIQDYDMTRNKADCGNVNLRVRSGFSDAPLSGVRTMVSGYYKGTSGYEYTDSQGVANFCCSSPSYCSVLAGNRAVTANTANFHSFYSAYTSDIYKYPSSVTVPVNNTSGVWYPDIYLWPVRTGTINVTVSNSVNGQPVLGATVALNPWNTGSQTKTASTGTAVFTGICESWPPSDLRHISLYNTSSKTHSISASAPGFINNSTTTRLKPGENKQVDILLVPEGAM